MPLYEHVFLARQDISPQQVETLTKEFSQAIDEGGGRVGKTEYWGLKSLSHKIKKNRKAHYTLMNIDAPPAAVAEMERRMGISTDVLRFLTVRVDEHETGPSVQMRKSDRDERGDRGGFRGDRGGGFRGGPRGDRPPREGGFRSGDRGPRGPRPDRDDARPRQDGETE
jgi:small subunit ribosomal protein S6